jgi:hypothetical protein
LLDHPTHAFLKQCIYINHIVQESCARQHIQHIHVHIERKAYAQTYFLQEAEQKNVKVGPSRPIAVVLFLCSTIYPPTVSLTLLTWLLISRSSPSRYHQRSAANLLDSVLTTNMFEPLKSV